ncbi:MFS transporter [Gracilibacillus caseinilyticus]|uniref:MFS transporter n=1 Tax=Gracilibacillus caseinilyticus TaxID=2932256 RepID=A0ABY4EQY7_9BACI|nr:MFS transporter [Gracilibacillus caseinilyticus]UOQ46837.1 MFS transporter [Gracilibacillus caseinilyticus]
MYFVMVTWLLIELTGEAFYTGLLVSVGFLPGLVMNLLFGVIVDRFDRRLLTLCSSWVSFLTLCSMAFIIWGGWLTALVIMLTHMVIQLTGSLFRPAMQAFIAENFTKERLPKVFSQTSTAAIIGGLIGSSLGGVIIGFLSEIAAIGIVCVAFLVASIALFGIRGIQNNKYTAKKSIKSDFTEGFRYLRSNRLLLQLFGVMFIGQLVFHTCIAFLSPYTIEYLNQSAQIYGLLDAFVSIGGVIAGLLGTWWWNKSKNYLSVSSLLVVIFGLLSIGWAPSLFFAFAGALLIGIGTTWIRVLLQSVQQIATDKAFHGRMSSYRMICNQGSVVISGPILGWIASTYGANMVYTALLLPVVAAIIFAFRQSKHQGFIQITKRKTA